MTVGSKATLTFKLDTLGVTPIFLYNNLSVDASGRLVVDGTDYEALDGYIPRIYAANRVGGFYPINITFIGLADREPALVVQNDGLWLRLIAPPAVAEHLFSLVPASTVAPDYDNTQFSASRALDPSGSPWGLTLNEAHVMDARLKQDVLDGGTGQTNRSWDLRIGRGGQIYSLRTPALGFVFGRDSEIRPTNQPICDQPVSVWVLGRCIFIESDQLAELLCHLQYPKVQHHAGPRHLVAPIFCPRRQPRESCAPHRGARSGQRGTARI